MTSLDDALEALHDPQRRRLLVALLGRNPLDDSPAAIGEVTVDSQEYDRLLLGYHHVHLPKLEALGLIDWDSERGEVTRGPAFEEVRPLVELLDSRAEQLPGEWP
jgi:hypothetical protein